MHPHHASHPAFTLVELVVVLVVLSILAALTVPTGQALTERSRERVTVASATAYRNSIDAHAAVAQLPADQLDTALLSTGGALAEELPEHATAEAASGTVVVRLSFGSRQHCAEIVLAATLGTPSSVGLVTCPEPSPPGAPMALVATSRNAAAVLSWDAPDPGTAPIVDYLVEYSTGDGWVLVDDGVSSTPGWTVTGLVNDVLHTFRVTAVNAVGPGPSAVASATPALEWTFVSAAGSTANDLALAATTTADGGVVVGGQFVGSVSFGSTTLTAAGCPSTGTCTDAFVAKIDVAGNWVWAQRAGGTLSESVRGLAPAPDGGAYVVGAFNATTAGMQFPTRSGGSITLANAGGFDLFVAKMSGDGYFEWARRAGGAGLDAAYGVVAAGDGLVFVGRFSGSDIAFGTEITRSSTAGTSDVLVAHLTDGGAWSWVSTAGGPSTDDFAYAVTALPGGDIVAVGQFAGTATFGDDTLVSGGSTDTFAARLDGATGAWVWAAAAGSSLADLATSVVASASGVVVAGGVGSTALFGSISVPVAGSSSGFVAGIDPDNGSWQWALPVAGGGGGSAVRSLASTTDGGVVLAGVFTGTSTFGATDLTSAGGYDLFVAELAGDGTWRWATRAGGAATDDVYAAPVAADGAVFVAGAFETTATFGEFDRATAGASDLFVGRIAP